MFLILVFVFCIIPKIWCFTPNCVPENQFKFQSFPVIACSEYFLGTCKNHSEGFFKSLGEPSLVKIEKTAVVPTCAFVNSEYLRRIYGVGSNIKVLATGSFMNLSNLEAIHLALNDIREVRKDIFKNVSVEMLDMSWNKIAFIEPQAFAEMTNLKYLNLSKNVLVTVPINSLSRTLVDLNLSFNLLQRIALNSNNFLHLTHVDLSNNVIKYVAFHIEYPMESIDLTNNRLHNFDYLDIRSVKIFKIGNNLFQKVPRFLENLNAKSIDIYPNPWKCNNLLLLWKLLSSFDIQLVPKDPKNSLPECMKTPTLLGSRLITKQCVDDYACPSSMVCRTKKCWDPCEEFLCHNTSLCTTQNHKLTCSCPNGYRADPMDIYAKCEKIPEESSCIGDICRQDSPIPNIPLPPPPIIPQNTVGRPWWFEEIPNIIPPPMLSPTTSEIRN